MLFRSHTMRYAVTLGGTLAHIRLAAMPKLAAGVPVYKLQRCVMNGSQSLAPFSIAVFSADLPLRRRTLHPVTEYNQHQDNQNFQAANLQANHRGSEGFSEAEHPVRPPWPHGETQAKKSFHLNQEVNKAELA